MTPPARRSHLLVHRTLRDMLGVVAGVKTADNDRR